jgi:hypothetical protein
MRGALIVAAWALWIVGLCFFLMWLFTLNLVP